MLDFHGGKAGPAAQSSYQSMLMMKLDNELDSLAEMCEGPMQALRILPSTGGCGADSRALDTIIRLCSVSKSLGIDSFDPLLHSCIKAMARGIRSLI